MTEFSLICSVISRSNEIFIITLTDSSELVEIVERGSSTAQPAIAQIDSFNDDMSLAIYLNDGRLLYVPSQARPNASAPLLGTWQSARSRHRMIITQCMSGFTPLKSEWYSEQLQNGERLPDTPLRYRRHDLAEHLEGSESLEVQVWIWNGNAYVD